MKSARKASRQLLQALDCVLDPAVFRVLSEEVRIDLFKFLLLKGPADVGTIASAFPVDRSVVSRHLSMMEDVELLRSEKLGRSRIYSVDLACFIETFEEGAKVLRELGKITAGKS
ncbi:MAG: helix-turn-helix domain-containing protein [bacterium]|nr:helix-turn-helix domain-containing protein [bacterium]